ncbi:MAG TPA: pyruvate dehydrogenase (acetyl-transferring), homodimeric type [Solirubrobacteraceae bacterium]|nr:pyruvate dehydrogenase (acetyl-transferring), homodimeric type [Solirubrobacteraceae bacterium]
MTDRVQTSTSNGAGADVDAIETSEWLEALDAVVAHDGPVRARDLLTRVIERAQQAGTGPIASLNTPYVNTIPAEREPPYPGDPELDRRLRSIMRWNAIAIVVRANKVSSELGGHIASYQSLATLYEVGFNHFWHAPSESHGGDLVYFQGHSSPGNYARAFLEGRLTERQLLGFRQEVDGAGLSSYPHPWLMPDFWQFPTVSLGIGPITSIYQARFMKYLEARGFAQTAGRKVWTFCGDGEMDEPESMGAIGLAGREHLDNLIWVVNCNLQRLDGPVRGNGKIIQELEADFRGAGWNVIKVIWGSRWDPLLAEDHDDALLQVMEGCVDGDYQTFKSRDGAYVREHFFGRDPRLLERVKNMTDDEIWLLNRGGHDQQKVFAAYDTAVRHAGQPTVILAKTVKGYGMGVSGEGQMITHQAKKMTETALLHFRDRFELPLTDEQVKAAEFYRPTNDSAVMEYMRERRAALGGPLPVRRRKAAALPVPPLSEFQSQLDGTGEREISTTMAFVRILAALLRDKQIGRHVVPIIPDESRTFGMEGMFRQVGIYSPVGQLYQPQDSEQLMFYKEDRTGQILEEGITEAGSMSTFIAAGTSYSAHAVPMVPFYIYYSMFGYQRVGDLVWAAGDSRTRGFMLGGTAGRTTLNGEGLQHEDGHSHVLFSVVPNCCSYDPTYGFEVAVIIQEGLRRMIGEQEDVFYYLTLMNENYQHPAMPAGAEDGILRGMYLLREGSKRSKKPRVQLLGSGTMLREVLAAADLLADDWGIVADVWSVTSFTELRRDGIEVDRWNLLHPTEEQRTSFVEQSLGNRRGPVVASTDYVRTFADQIRTWVPREYRVLGTDGFGRSDYRRALRRFFEVDRHYVAVSALKELADSGEIDAATVQAAIDRYEIDAEAPIPTSV